MSQWGQAGGAGGPGANEGAGEAAAAASETAEPPREGKGEDERGTAFPGSAGG